jgi:hypothetical protein
MDLRLSPSAVANVLPGPLVNLEAFTLQVLFGIGEKVQDLKSNVDKAAKTKDDAAEQVTPESPGSSQESNAEKVRQQAGECTAECLLAGASAPYHEWQVDIP